MNEKILWVCPHTAPDFPVTIVEPPELHTWQFWGKLFPNINIALGAKWAEGDEAGVSLDEALGYDVIVFVFSRKSVWLFHQLLELGLKKIPKIVFAEDGPPDQIYGFPVELNGEPCRSLGFEFLKKCDGFFTYSIETAGFYSPLVPAGVHFVGSPMPDSVTKFRLPKAEIEIGTCWLGGYFGTPLTEIAQLSNYNKVMLNNIRAAIHAGFLPIVHTLKPVIETEKFMKSYCVDPKKVRLFYNGDAMIDQREWMEKISHSETALFLEKSFVHPGRMADDCIALGVPIIATDYLGTYRRFCDYITSREFDRIKHIGPENISEAAELLKMLSIGHGFREKYLQYADDFYWDELCEEASKKRMNRAINTVMER